MDYEYYRSLYNDVLKLDEDFDTVLLPVEIEPGETEDEAFIRFLLSEGFIESQEDRWRIPDREKVYDYDPNLLKVLDAISMASLRAEMDELIEQGLFYMTADDEGNIVYEPTEKGRAYIDEQD